MIKGNCRLTLCEEINLLFTADSRYAKRIPVVLKSLCENDPGRSYHVYLISDDLDQKTEQHLASYCEMLGYGFSVYKINAEIFSDAPVNKYYTLAMYYRHLAFRVLPETVRKVIYLDPDILIINPLHPLWEINPEGHLFLAASHTEDNETLDDLNRVRLGTNSPYYNTGVIVMDLDGCRKEVSEADIFSYIQENASRLLLPDQDVFNALYGAKSKSIPDVIWNYDARFYAQYLLNSNGEYDERWVMKNTVILHFCGKNKPWDKRLISRFDFLYLHYEELTRRSGWSNF